MDDKEKFRREFLINMYNQMFNDINRHITVTWQSITTFVGAFAIFALAEREIISVDIASTLVVLICGWLIAHVIDASYWYNRNLAIIANIEKEFLEKDDLWKIHYYFGQHRPKNRMIHHLKIQFFFGLTLGLSILIFHFLTIVIPSLYFSLSLKSIDLSKWFPYIALIVISIYIVWVIRHRSSSYKEFLKNSPGIKVDTTDIIYGKGHAFGFMRKIKRKKNEESI